MQKKEIKDLLGDKMDSEGRKQLVKQVLNDPERIKELAIEKAKQVSKFENSMVSEPELDSQFKKVLRRIGRKPRIKYASVAAVVVLFLSFGLYYFNTLSINSQLVQVTTAIGGKEQVVLPDGTKVLLNANSEIQYPKVFKDDIREVTLIGEALFEVVRNEHKPLVVKTYNGLAVRVLGTVFNVKSYPDDKEVQTTLVSGKVEVIKDNNSKAPIVLKPFQQAAYNKKDKKLIVDTVNALDAISWKDNKLIFNETPLEQVVQDLQRKYNVTFKIISKELLDYKYSGTFDNLTIKECMRLLKVSSPIDYTITNNIITLKQE
ncbi:FecR family protein [Snuella lapsa]|uniref:FecR family protein n=1 Tax=Snuella lapsa TaxID=870481 RepID=A0ABP6YGQ3_9FLAO